MKIKNVIISETIQVMPIKFAMNTVRPKVYNYNRCESGNLDLHLKVTSASQPWLLLNLHYLGQYLSNIQTWYGGRVMYAPARFNDFEFDLDFETVGKACLLF